MAKVKSKKRISHFAECLTGAMLFIVAGIMPLVVRLYAAPMPPELLSLMVAEQYADFFAYWKSWFLMIPALVIALYFLADLAIGNRWIDFKALFRQPPFILLSVYVLFIVLSNIFSPYRYTALYGTYQRFEGVFAQLAYIVVFLATLWYARERKYIKVVLFGLLFSSLVMGALGVGQLFGKSFFATRWGNLLVTGVEDTTSVVFTSAFGTLYNPNTYGLYTSMLAPLLLFAGFTYAGGHLIVKIIVKSLLLAAGVMMLAGIVASDSLGGFIGILAAIMTLTVTYIGYLIYQKKVPSWPVFAVIALIAGGSLAAYRYVEPLRRQTSQIISDLKAALNQEQAPPAMDYSFEDGAFKVTLNEGLLFELSPGDTANKLVIGDASGAEVPSAEPVASEDGSNLTYHYEIPGYGTVTIIHYPEPDFFSYAGLYMAVREGRIVPFWKNGVSIDIETPIPVLGFEGQEMWGSSRGYIWSRSLPLLSKYWLLGSGSDSYINAFPQHDIIAKQRFLYDWYQVIDKAHNLYLQTGITTGGISMLTLMGLLGYYLWTTFIALIKSKGESAFSFGLRIGALASVSAFAVASMATDSTIGSTGVFYMILGLGYALNIMTKKKKEAEEDRR